MKKAKKRKLAFLMFFAFFQGCFLTTMAGLGIYEKKMLPELREQHQQIHQLLNYIDHMQKHMKITPQKNSKGETVIWQQIQL